MTFWKSFCVLALAIGFVSPSFAKGDKSETKLLKKSLKSAPVELRNQIISEARVFNPESKASSDLIQDLQKICGSQFQYQKENGSYAWPVVECEYKADDGGLGGFSPKFLCEFSDPNKKDGKVTRKVKYADQFRQFSSSEIVPTILASNMARLLGFYTESYCPAQVVCKNCPSQTPWKDQRASAPAGKSNYTFEKAIVEIPLGAMTVSNPHQESPQAQGLEWEELKIVQNQDPIKARQMRIEREAWVLWINILMETDSFHFNQKVSCLQGQMESGSPVCTQPIVYTHDYGHSFYEKYQFRKWEKTPALVNAADGTCRGALTTQVFQEERKNPFRSLLTEPSISSEARDLLLTKFSQVSDEQWMSIFDLSKASEIGSFPPVSSRTWLKAIKKKINELKSAQCQTFDSGRSILAF